jgi:hypothetical protein
VIALISFALLNSRGIDLTPDGWAYWQGAVSLVEGKGYRYFSGHPIVAWPPLYSLYLAAWILVTGPTGLGLVIGNALLIFIQAWLWCYVLLTIWCDTGEKAGLLPRLVVAVYVGLFTASTQQGVLADVLKYTLAPLLLLATWKMRRTDASVSSVQGTALAAVAGSLTLLAHSDGVALVGASAVLIGTTRVPRRRRDAAIVAIVSLLVWTIVRRVMDQSGSHAIGVGVGHYGPGTYLLQLVRAAGSLLAADQHGLSFLAASAGLVLTSVMLRRQVGNQALRFGVLFVGLSAAFTYALFNVVWVSDPIGERFLLFLPIILVPFWVLASARGPVAGFVACSLLILLPVLCWTGAGIWIRNTATLEDLGFPGGFAPRSARVSSLYPQGSPRETGRGLLLAPVVWEESKASQTGDHDGRRGRRQGP